MIPTLLRLKGSVYDFMEHTLLQASVKPELMTFMMGVVCGCMLGLRTEGYAYEVACRVSLALVCLSENDVVPPPITMADSGNAVAVRKDADHFSDLDEWLDKFAMIRTNERDRAVYRPW